ncbi:HEAT repeat domain-containing protein [Methylolobus aquaticus]
MTKLQKFALGSLAWVVVSAASEPCRAVPSDVPRNVVATRTASGFLTLDARAAPLGAAIDELSRVAGVAIHYSVLPKEVVTATCAGTSLLTVLACLVGPAVNVVAVDAADAARGGSEGQANGLWITGSSLAPRGETGESGAGGCTPAAGRKPIRSDRDIRTARLTRKEKADLIEKSTGQDAVQRADAVARLVLETGQGDVELRRVLEAGLTDKDARVRVQAVYGLAREPSPEALPALREALHDVDPDVRLMAVDSIGADAAMRPLLEEALGDSDETVRQVAATKLRSADR